MAFFASVSLFMTPPIAWAALLRNVPIEAEQPDGTVLHLIAEGDEFMRIISDRDGYSVVRDPVTNLIVYADLEDGVLTPTPLVVGEDDPRSAGLVPGIRPSPEVYRKTRSQREQAFPVDERSAPHFGEMNNIWVFVRFADDDEFDSPISELHDMTNDSTDGAASLTNYYLSASYGALTVHSHFYPQPEDGMIRSYQDEHERAYYRPYSRIINPNGYSTAFEQMEREQGLLKRAFDSIIDQIPEGMELDGDGDGMVDNVVFVISGSPDGWADLLWPHMSVQIMNPIEVGDLFILTYNFQLWDYLMQNMDVGVLAHEMFHSLGAPDLYHYSYDGFTPAGPWDLMEWSSNVPQHMMARMKERYGEWISDIPEITESGTYTLKPLLSPTDNAWKMPIPGRDHEWIYVEYRLKSGVFEGQLPDSGLLFYRVQGDENGNASGPPDEVYVFRPGGSPTEDGRIANAAFSLNNGRSEFSTGTDPYPFDSKGQPLDLLISDISAVGDTISFAVCMRYLTCFNKNCGDDGCGGVCGECDPAQVCDDGVCSEEQSCHTVAVCLEQCGQDDTACENHCHRVPVVCAEPNACQLQGTCDEDTGVCEYPSKPDNTPCDDSNKCSQTDNCVEGECVGGDWVVCEPTGNPCKTAPECYPGTGGCRSQSLSAETPCDDSDLCTIDDACDGKGTCVGSAYTCETAICVTSNLCDGQGGCIATFSGTGTACDDADLCTSDDLCDGAGACLGTAIACEAGQCETNARCEDGVCEADAAPEGDACQDDDPCTIDSACDGDGNCVGTPYSCEPALCEATSTCDGQGGCTVTAVTAGTSCDDGNPETTDSACDGAGKCVATVSKTSSGCSGGPANNNVGQPLWLIALLTLGAIFTLGRRKKRQNATQFDFERGI